MKKILFITFLFSLSIQAEYRVYQYIVTNKVQSASDENNSNFIRSTLDPVTYLAYHGGAKLVEVELLRTWICPGYTGNGKDLCASPYSKSLVAKTDKKRVP